MVFSVFRGICRVTAAMTGVLLVYGISYALEGTTTRIPMGRLSELAITTLWMLPWTLLFCSGAEDFQRATRQGSVFWVGITLALALLYYLEHYASDSFLTKVVMPLLAITGGTVPHLVRRVTFVFTFISIAAGIGGLAVIYFEVTRFLSGSVASFASATIGFLIFGFVGTSIATGVLSVPHLWRDRTEMT